MPKRDNDPKVIEWRRTLQPGDLVLVSYYKSGYVHVARLREPKKADNDDLRLWSARALCGGSSGWYADVHYNDGTSAGITSWSRCKRCMGRWRKLGEPTIKQADTPAVAGIWLAFGWQAVPVAGIKFDLGSEATDDDVAATTDDADKVWGEKRVERQRWQRGDLYVRIVELFADDEKYRFATRYGNADDPKSDDWTLKGDLKSCLARASRLMAEGGTPAR